MAGTLSRLGSSLIFCHVDPTLCPSYLLRKYKEITYWKDYLRIYPSEKHIDDNTYQNNIQYRPISKQKKKKTNKNNNNKHFQNQPEDKNHIIKYIFSIQQ